MSVTNAEGNMVKHQSVLLSIEDRSGLIHSEQDLGIARLPEFLDPKTAGMAPQRLTLETVVDDTSTNSDVSVSMGLIVTELVINAIKDAFPDETSGGKITVQRPVKTIPAEIKSAVCVTGP